jgi:hypothetical protein
LPNAGDLAAFIPELRSRLDCGELAGHPPIDQGNGHSVVDLELADRVLLCDVTHGWTKPGAPLAER